MQLIFPAILIALMYMLLIRPQQQRARRQKALVSSLAEGDRVVSIGGIIGVITSIDDEQVELDVDDGVTLTFLRQAISRKIDPTEPPPADEPLTDDNESGPPEPVDELPEADA